MKPQNFEEKLVWYSITGTYVIYFIGALYVWIPALAWFLMFRLFYKIWQQTEDTPESEKLSIPYALWIWVVAMLVMELAVIMGILDFNLGVSKIIGATLVWLRGWALMALIPLIGCFRIRPQLIYRAACIVCFQSIFFAILAYTINAAHIPFKYVTPWWFVLRGDPVPYTVELLTTDLESGELRLYLFTPVANALGLAGSIYFYLACQEANTKWRWLGMIGGAVMVLGSVSRMPTICIFLVPRITWFLTNFNWRMQIFTGIASFVGGLFAPQIIDYLKTTWRQATSGYRAGSKIVRDRLKEIAIDRFEEAPIWGHGIIEGKGPKVTEFMPIGTHHQWAGLLYLKGIVGFIAFLIPYLWTLLELLVKAQRSKAARASLTIFISLLIATNGGEIETAAYLFWPGLVLAGIAFNEEFQIDSDSENSEQLRFVNN